MSSELIFDIKTSGRIRSNLMPKRIDHSTRSVAGPCIIGDLPGRMYYSEQVMEHIKFALDGETIQEQIQRLSSRSGIIREFDDKLIRTNYKLCLDELLNNYSIF